MLKTRIITALFIAALLIPAIFLLDSLSWAVLTAVISTATEIMPIAQLRSVSTSSRAHSRPITVRGAVLPALSSDVVETGPQPPPPVASTNPPARPSGTRNFAVCGERRAWATAGGFSA